MTTDTKLYTMTSVFHGKHAELNYCPDKCLYILHLVGRVVYLSEDEVKAIYVGLKGRFKDE